MAFQLYLDLIKMVEKVFYSYGLFASKHPWQMILFSGVIIILFCYPLLNLPLPGNEPSKFSTASKNLSFDQSWQNNLIQDELPSWLNESEPLAYIQQFIIKSTVRPWPGDDKSQKAAFRSSVSSVFQFLNVLSKFTYNNSSVFDNCYHFSNNVIKDNKRFKFLFPNNGCLVVSPALFWKGQEVLFENDKDVMKTIMQYAGKTINKSPSVEELLFGIPSKSNGVKFFYSKKSNHLLSYAVTIVLKKYDPIQIHELQKFLQDVYQVPLLTSYTESCWQKHDEENNICRNSSQILTHINYKPQLKISDLYKLLTVDVIFGGYIYFSVKKIHFLKSKLGMAVSAIISSMASLMTSVGLCVRLGFTPIHISSELYPYLVCFLCLENILGTTKSVVTTSNHDEAEERVAIGLSKEGYSIFKSLLLQYFIVTVALCSGSPEFQEIARFFGIATFSDFFMHMTFFVPILSIDIRRRLDLLEETSKCSLNGSYIDEYKFNYSFKASLERVKRSVEVEKHIKPTHLLEIGSSQIVQFSKRLKVFFFFAKTKVVQRSLLTLFTAWYVLSLFFNERSTSSHFSYKTQLLSRRDVTLLEQNHEEVDVFSDISFNAKDLLSFEQLSYRHWPTLFAYYNISLNNNYISILPSIAIPIINKLDLTKLNPNIDERIEKEHELVLPQIDISQNEHLEFGRYEMETRLQYYMTLLIGGVSGIFLFMMATVLYKCICSRNYANWKKRVSKQTFSDEYYSSAGDCVPLALTGHVCQINVVDIDGVSVASSDLSGEIKVWDSYSGECCCTISRKYNQLNGVDSQNSNGSCITQRSSVWTLLIKDKFVFAGCENGNIEIWDSVSGTLKGLHGSNKASVLHMVCEDGTLVCARINGTLDFFDLIITNPSPDSNLQYRGHNRQRVVNGLNHPLNSILECENLQLVSKHTVKSAHQRPITVLKLHSTRLVTGSSDNTLKLFDLKTGTCEQTFFGHCGAVTALHLELTHPFAAVSGASDGSVCLWSLRKESYIMKLNEHKASVLMVCCSEWHIVSSAQDDQICVWSRKSGRFLRTIHLAEQSWDALCLLNSNWCVSGSKGEILLWDVRTGEKTRTIRVGGGALTLPDVRQVLSLGNLSILCVVGREMFVARLPSVLEKVE